MNNRIRWEDVESGTYEDMVAVLISRLYPSCRRIDGSGGDGGRDVLLPLPEGLEIFELKSFTGRLSGSRRTQVKRSLARAAEHEPLRWHLVVPIDPTPAEDRWFAELTATYTFDCDWLGKTWLDSQLAGHPDIHRHFLRGTSDEVVRLLIELQREQAALAGGVPDALDRLQALAAQVNEIDPFYGFVLTSRPDGGVSVAATPKYPGAENDRPVRISGTFQFQDDEKGRTAAAELSHELLEAVVRQADQVLARNADVIEGHLAEVTAAGHVLDRLDLDAGRPHVNDDLGEPLVSRHVGIGPGDQVAPVGCGRPRGPDLASPHHPIVAIRHGPRAQ